MPTYTLAANEGKHWSPSHRRRARRSRSDRLTPARATLVAVRAVMTVRGTAAALWLLAAVPAAAGWATPDMSSPYGDALQGASPGFATAATAGLWTLSAAVGVALMLPGASALTAVRIAVPANAVAALWAADAADAGSWSGYSLTLTAALGAAVMVLLPTFSDAVVNAAGYGDERRYLLRPARSGVGLHGRSRVGCDRGRRHGRSAAAGS